MIHKEVKRSSIVQLNPMKIALLVLFMLNTLQRIGSLRPSLSSAILKRPVYQQHRHPNIIKLKTSNRLSDFREMSQFATTTFKVTPEEEELFSTLRRVVKEENLGTVIR